MMYLHDIANLIKVRDFLANSVDNLSIKLDNSKVKEIQNKVTQLNKEIIHEALKLQFSPTSTEFTFVSTQDTEKVLKDAIANSNTKNLNTYASVSENGVVTLTSKELTEVVMPTKTDVKQNAAVESLTEEVKETKKSKKKK